MENCKNTGIIYFNPATKYKKKEDEIVNIVYAHHVVYNIASAIFPTYMCTCICT